MKPSIDTAKKLASFLDTSVGYLLGETEDDDLLKDQDILKDEIITEAATFEWTVS